MPTSTRKRGHRRTAAECQEEPRGNLWKRKPLNANGSPNVSSAENPRCAFLSRERATIRCTSVIDAVKAALYLHEIGVTLYEDDDELPDDDDPGY